MPTLPTQFSFKDGDDFPATTPGKLRIYSMRFCPFAHRARIVLAHKNIDFETVNMNLKQRPDWFLARNPGGQVPVAEIDGKVLYESTAVSEWLDEIYPGEKLTPSDPFRKAQDRILLESFGKVATNLYKMLKEETREQALKDIQESLQFYEDALAKRGKYFGGDKMSMIDVYMWPNYNFFIAGNLNKLKIDLLPKDKYPRLREWYHNTMRNTPAVKATTQPDDGYEAYINIYAAGGIPDYDYKLQK